MSGMLSNIKNQIKRLWRITPDPTALWWFLGVLALSLLLALLMPEGGLVAWLLEAKSKPDTLQLIGWGMGGVLAAIVALALNRRAAAMEKGLIDERFKAAVQSLAGEQPSVRIAAFYQFYYLAKDSADIDFKSNIFEILCAHLRQMTSVPEYRDDKGRDNPTEECQSLLDVLFKKSQQIFSGMTINMRGAYLVGTNLREASFVRANLQGAKIQKATFQGANASGASIESANASEANFREANVSAANFQGANVSKADFQKANVSKASFQKANVSAVNFKEANVSKASFQKANVSAANFKEANVSEADFEEANVSKADFQEADLSRAYFWNANVSAASFYEANMSHARFYKASMSHARFYKANLSEAYFHEANLSRAYFWNANASGADFKKADVSDADFREADLRGADFSSAKGIDSAEFSDIKIDSETKFPKWFQEGEHYTVAKEEE